MRKRCNNPNSTSYRYYGARGIKVCEDWASFESFYRDMGDPPEGLSLDRIDPGKDYCPGNCRWATAQQQAENRRNQMMYVVDGESLTLPKLCEKVGINYRTLKSRMCRTGLSLEQAITHKFGEITEQGMAKLRLAVIESNIRRGLK